VPRLRLALSQLDTVVGDIGGNVERAVAAMARAEAAGAQLVVFPELTVTGYPPEDLLLKPGFLDANLDALDEIALSSRTCAAAVGFVDVAGDGSVPEAVAVATGVGRAAWEQAMRGAPRLLRNALALCAGGRVLGVFHKRRLPNYGVFDEERWFAPGAGSPVLYEVGGALVGMSVCEDLWFARGPVAEQAAAGASLVVNANASPFARGRLHERVEVAAERVAEAGCALAYVNQVGGQDELVFDGGSFVMDAAGSVTARAGQFDEALLVVDVDLPESEAAAGTHVVHVSGAPSPESASRTLAPAAVVRTGAGGAFEVLSEGFDDSEESEVYRALVLGTRDYLRKNGFTDAVIGLSGGIDSSLVAAVAVDALGPSHVHGLSMPSRYSSEGSRTDATALAERLGIDLRTVPIEAAHVVLRDLVGDALGGEPAGLADENLQSRIRGVLLMAVSNAEGWIVLTTGNKSELATGYSTLYGDSAGGFAVIKDVPKTLVYRLCRFRNVLAGTDLIPSPVLVKAPSAELRPDQRDDDSLPPYEVLDPLLEGLVDHDRTIADLVAEGYDAALVTRVARLVDLAEYKRRQSPPGVRISAKAFGKDRRMPITNRYRDRAPESAAAPGHGKGGLS
jgi:NAD+ synthase (glutamine-hydrolysing)